MIRTPQIILFALVLLFVPYRILGQASSSLSWQAGQVVVKETVEQAGGLDSCFRSMPLPDDVWQRMQGKTYQPNPYISRSDLLYLRLLHVDIDGRTLVGEMVCHRTIAARLVRIFRELYVGRYPIERMVLPDNYDADDERQMRANNTSCFCFRAIAGSTHLSHHARGLAVDINTLYNPYYRDKADGTRFVQPATAARFCNRNADFPYKIVRGDLCYRLFRQNGFTWGGEWNSCKDFQHFQLNKP